MPTIRLPVLTWHDDSGGHTAALVGDSENAAAHAGTAKEALQNLKELLEWRLENESWNVDPDLEQPDLIQIKVEVLPQYTERKRVLPCPETLWLKVPCVTGVQENGLRVCAVPHLGLRFIYQDAAGLKGLAAHYIKEALQGLSPLQLAGRLPPRGCQLEQIVLRDSSQRPRRIPPADRPELKVLFTVADPLLHDLGRKRVASAAYGREGLSTILARKLGHDKANVLLVGESGVGKSTLLLDAVKRLGREEPVVETETGTDDLRTYRFWRGSAGRMIAGMRYLGEWEERCEEFILQLKAIEGVFCAENLLELLQVGGQSAGDSVAAFLLPYLQRGELRLVAEATPAEVEACRRLYPGLLDVFQVLPVPEFTNPEAIEVLGRVANAHAAAARLKLGPGVVVVAHALFKRFLPYSAFPGPAANFIRQLCDSPGRRHPPLPLRGGEGRGEGTETQHRPTAPPDRPDPAGEQTITTAHVVAQFIKQTGLPETFLRDDMILPLEEVQRSFEAQIIGQPEATLAAAQLVTQIKSGLTDPRRPFGVLMFCGPTGVGKTALARAISDFCFGATGHSLNVPASRPSTGLLLLPLRGGEGRGEGASIGHSSHGPHAPGATGQKDRQAPPLSLGERAGVRASSSSNRLVRLDMSEYSGWGAATRLLQSANGTAAPWIEQVRRQPFCVLLFDEIEKAAAEVFDVLLGLLDEGRLTDRFGRPTSFRSAIIILTSNLGSSNLGAAGFRPDAAPTYESEVGKFFRPEFFNRLDGVITFRSLSPADVEMITRKELGELAAREGLAGLRIQWSERLVKALAREGHDHRLGARPLQRALERLVVTPLARWKVAHPAVRGAVLRIDLDPEKEGLTIDYGVSDIPTHRD